MTRVENKGNKLIGNIINRQWDWADEATGPKELSPDL
jgi:hypothetical protein